MFDARIGTLLRRAAGRSARADVAAGDAALLGRYARGRDPAAFAELVTRHGAAVWGLCRRLLRTEADAEDVFQATFLVLARDPGRVRKAASVGSWLYGVAARLGRKARAKLDRPPPDPTALPPPPSPPDPAADVSWAEVRAALDEELGRLPDALRAPLLLCYFEGLTQDEAAAALGWKPRTLKARVARGRRTLRTRLARRGIELPGALAVPLLVADPASAVPLRLADAAAQLTRLSPGPDVSPAVLTLARTELPIMSAPRLAAVLTAAALLAAGTALGLRARPSDDLPAPTTAAEAAGAPQPAGPTLIGSAQFRHAGWHSRVFLTDGGNTLVLAGEGLSVQFWDVTTGRKLDEIAIRGGLHDAAFAPDADVLAVAGSHQPAGENGAYEHALWLIDVAARKLVRTVGSPVPTGGNHQKVRVSVDGKRVVVEYEGDVRVLDGTTGKELARHKARINAGTLAMSRDGRQIAFGRGAVFLWSGEPGEEPTKLTTVGGFGVELLQFDPSGKTLLVAERGGVVTTWDVAAGRQTGSRPLRTAVGNLAFIPDGTVLAVASNPSSSRPPEGGHAIDLLDAATGKAAGAGRLPLGRAGVTHVSWSKDGTRVAGVSDYRAWVWDVKSGKVLGPDRPGHEGLIGAMAFGPDGTLFTAGDDHTIRSWDPATGAPVLELVHDHWVRDLAGSPDGALVAGSALRNDLRVWDAKTGKQRFKLLGNGQMGGKRRVRFTPDGWHLVAWGDDEFVRVWDVRSGKLVSEHSTRPLGSKDDPNDPFAARRRLDMAAFDAAALSADGTALALGTRTGVRILDSSTGKERQTLAVGDDWPVALEFSPDGKQVAVAFRGKPVQTKLADGRTRHSTTKEYPVAVWDLASGKPLWTATAEGVEPRLAYHPEGSRVAVVSGVWQGPSRVWVWDAATGREAGRIELPRRGHQLTFDRSGKRLAVSLADTTALVYDLDAALKSGK